MADTFSETRRSEIMALIRSQKNQTTELRMIALFRMLKVRGWRRNYVLTGKPDFVFPRCKLCLFVDGCFWHGCPIHGRVPKSRQYYWAPKISRNRSRDRRVTTELRDKGWTVLRVWEHELKPRRLGRLLARLRRSGLLTD